MPTIVVTSNTKWTCPAGVTSVTVHCIGGGGGGGGAMSNPSTGGGGAGGSYAGKVVTVIPEEEYDVVVGNGGSGGFLNGSNGSPSYFKEISEVFAQGGAGGGGTNVSYVNSSPGLGSISSCIGTIKYRGGHGSYGSYSGDYSGAGGGGAFYYGNGGDALNAVGGKGTATYGGDGGNGVSGTSNGESGSNYGGGGSGAIADGGKAGVSGGDGAPGVVVLVYDSPGYVDIEADLLGVGTLSAKPDYGDTGDISSSLVGSGALSAKISITQQEDLTIKVANIRMNSNGVIKHWWKLNYFQGECVPDPVITPVKYGLLYNWPAAADERNITSEGEFVVPSNEDWEDLFNAIDIYGDSIWPLAGGKLKEVGYTYFNPPNTGATNEYGFNGRGHGVRGEVGFNDLLINAVFWSLTVDEYLSDEDTRYSVNLYYEDSGISIGQQYFLEGNSIRLVRPATESELLLADGTSCTPYIGNDGKSYPTVKIGTQVWLASNLAETKYRNGDYINGFNDGIYTPISNAAWAAATSAMCCAYEDNLANV